MSFTASELHTLSTSSAFAPVKNERRHSRKLRTLLRKVTVFKHNHLTYKTCFGALHVKALFLSKKCANDANVVKFDSIISLVNSFAALWAKLWGILATREGHFFVAMRDACTFPGWLIKTATWLVGFNALIVICCSLFYCIFTSQEQRRPQLKLFAIPITATTTCLMFLFVGIIQKKAKLFYPFIALQVTTAFVTAVTMGMIGISVVCNTRYVLRHLVDVSVPEIQYKRSALVLLSLLGTTLFLQLWYLRTVCNCFRYFTDIERFKEQKEQGRI